MAAGFKKGVSAPTVFYNEERQLRCVVHGDDFTFLGFEKDLDHIQWLMSKWYEMKVRGRLDGEPGGQNETTILNRRVLWYGDSIRVRGRPQTLEGHV